MNSMATPGRFELPTCCFGGNRSIHLSYGVAEFPQNAYVSSREEFQAKRQSI
jgi:hypothetical protein